MNNNDVWLNIVQTGVNDQVKSLSDLTTQELSALEAVCRDERELRDMLNQSTYKAELIKEIFG